MRPAVLRRAAVVAAPVLLAACALLTWWHGHGSIWWAPQRCFSCNVTRVAFITAGLGSPYFDLAVRQVAATRQHFCPSKPYEAHYFVFTDRNASAAPSSVDVTFIRKVPQGWPRDSDDRYTWFIEAVRHHDLQTRFDYALWMDSDNHLVEDCCEDLLGSLVALRHGWSYTAEEEFPYEGRNESQAYVPQENRFQHYYYSAHIFGGTVDSFLDLAEACSNWTLIDRGRGIQAAVDDESYLQRYFWEHAPTVTLSYAFVYPEGIERPWSHGVKPMALALGKGVDHGRRLFHVPGPITLLTGDGGIRTGSP